MPAPIETGYIQSFRSNLEMLLQQKMSYLRGTVMSEMVQGEATYFDRIGPVEAKERVGEFNDLEPTQSPWERRRVTFAERYRAEYVGEMSKLRMIADPTSAYAQNSVYALNRAIDQIIVEAIFGTAWTGKDGTTPVTFDTTQVVPVGTTGLTIDKLIDAREMMDRAEIDPSEQRTMVVTSRQISNLLRETEVTNADYNTVKALVAGQIDTFMGFRFVRYESLPSATVGADTHRHIPFYVSSGLKLGVAKDISASADWIPDKRAWLLYAGLAMGATRMEEKRVGYIVCKE